jgi:HAMP domain-containing protein
LPKRTLLIILAAIAVVVAGGFALLATVDIPAPTSRIERTIPNDRLPR